MKGLCIKDKIWFLSCSILFIITSALFSQTRKDKIQLIDGTVKEGSIKKESYEEITLDSLSIPLEQIVLVEYYDAPDEFNKAMTSIRNQNYASAMSELSRAQEYVEKLPPASRPRQWFPENINYYKALCLVKSKKQDDSEQALTLITELLKKYPQSRFLKDTISLTFEAYGILNDFDAAKQFLNQLDKMPLKIKAHARFELANLAFFIGKISEAYDQFNQLVNEPSKEISNRAKIGRMRCFLRLEKFDELEKYCNQVLTTGQQDYVWFMSRIMLAEVFCKKKDYLKGVRELAQVIASSTPDVYSGYEQDHEKAFYLLSCCYEELANASKDNNRRKAYLNMLISTLRELLSNYPNSSLKNEANKKIQKYIIEEDTEK